MVENGKEALKKITQTNTEAERRETAKVCVATLQLTLPTLVDGEDNRVNVAYAGWPDRMYVIGADGRIAYQGGPGPGGFRPEEVERWLRSNVAK